MRDESDKTKELCNMCVFSPPNLPEDKYPREDWLELQQKACSFDYVPGDADCLISSGSRHSNSGWVTVASIGNAGFSLGDPEMLCGNIACYATASVQSNSRWASSARAVFT